MKDDTRPADYIPASGLEEALRPAHITAIHHAEAMFVAERRVFESHLGPLSERDEEALWTLTSIAFAVGSLRASLAAARTVLACYEKAPYNCEMSHFNSRGDFRSELASIPNGLGVVLHWSVPEIMEYWDDDDRKTQGVVPHGATATDLWVDIFYYFDPKVGGWCDPEDGAAIFDLVRMVQAHGETLECSD